MIILFDEIWFYFPFIFFLYLNDLFKIASQRYDKRIIPNINAARYQFYYNKE